MVDLTVEVHGDTESLEGCLDQFTAVEWLDGDKYRCDVCSHYVKVWKHLTVHQALLLSKDSRLCSLTRRKYMLQLLIFFCIAGVLCKKMKFYRRLDPNIDSLQAMYLDSVESLLNARAPHKLCARTDQVGDLHPCTLAATSHISN